MTHSLMTSEGNSWLVNTRTCCLLWMYESIK